MYGFAYVQTHFHHCSSVSEGWLAADRWACVGDDDMKTQK